MSHLERNNLRHDDGHKFQYRSNHRSKNANDERKSGGTIVSRSALGVDDEHGRTNRSDHQSVAATATANSGESANKRYSSCSWLSLDAIISPSLQLKQATVSQ